MDNRISQGSISQPLSKKVLGMKPRPNRLVKFRVKHGAFFYEAHVKEFEQLSMAEEYILLICIALASPRHRGMYIEPVQERQNGDVTELSAKDQLWHKLKVQTQLSPEAQSANLIDFTKEPMLMLKTTPTEILKALNWGTSGGQITRLIRSLTILASTNMFFRVEDPNYKYSFSSSLLSFVYTNPKMRTGEPTLKIGINHLSMQAITDGKQGYTFHQVQEKQEMSELENAVHSELCRLVPPGQTRGIRNEALCEGVYSGLNADKLTASHRLRCKNSLEKVINRMIKYQWQFRKRDETCFDIRRPAPPKSANYLKLANMETEV